MTPTLCPWDAPKYIFISENVPLLINYSHFIAIFSALSISFLVFLYHPREVKARLFLIFSSLFTVWALLNIILWATNDPGIVKFAWSMQVLIEPITYALAFYFFHIHVSGKIPHFYINLLITLLLLPILIFLPTKLNLTDLYLSSCEFEEGPLAAYYTYLLNILFITAIVVSGLKYIPKLPTINKKRGALLFSVGLLTFLLSFTSSNIISSFTDDWTISQYGLFGMPIFAGLIAYSIVQFNAFRIQVASSQILIVIVTAFVASLLFVDFELTRIIAGITLIFTTIVGYMLVKSVQKEFKQRLELERLTDKLEHANERLKELDKLKSEFVSIASHQLRSPITAIRGYTSLLLDGSYGTIPNKAQEALERIEKSSGLMATSIEDYLNVSRIESGNMKYNLSDFNLRDEVEHITDDLRSDATKNGLGLLFRTNLNSQGVVHADIGKTVQIVQNLVNNSIKYTEKGSVTVLVRDDVKRKKIYVDITDTGIGMSQKTIATIFEKFSRADNADSVNTSGTGLGLYVAKMMANAMGGTITAYSEGDGKGSRFTLEMPLAL